MNVPNAPPEKQNSSPSSQPSNIQVLKDVAALISQLLGWVLSILGIVEIWQGNTRAASYAFLAIGSALLFGGLACVAFARKKPEIETSNKDIKIPPIPLYPKYYNLARFLLGLALIIGIVMAGTLAHRLKVIDNKFVVLITNLDNEADTHRITDQLTSILKKNSADFSEILIITISDSVTEIDGEQKALRLGRQFHADIVLWGWYSVSDTDVLLTLHIENLSDNKILPIDTSEIYIVQDSIGTLNNFTLSKRFSNEITALSLFLSGIFQYEIEKYDEAITRFNGAIETGEWADDILSKSILHYYTAKSHLILGNSKTALEESNVAIQINSEYPELYLVRALANKNLRNHDDAIIDYQEALSLTPNNVEALVGLGNVYFDLESYNEAERLYGRAIGIDSGYLHAHVALGRLFFRRGDYDKAEAEATTALNLDPANISGYKNRGLVYLNTQQYEHALNDYNAAIMIDGNDANLYNSRGIVYWRSGKYDQAINDFLTTIMINPNFSWAYWNITATCEEGSKIEMCITMFTERIISQPKDPHNYMIRQVLYQHHDKYEQALQDVLTAKELDPSNPYIIIELARLYQIMGEHQLAIETIDEAIKINPEYAFAYFTKGEIYYSERLFDDAIREYSHAIYLDVHYQNAYLNRGIIYYAMGDNEKALLDFSKAVSINPVRLAALQWRATVYINMGAYEKALSDLSLGISNYPNDPWNFLTRGDLYRQIGKYEMAIENLTLVIEMQNGFEDWAHFYRGNVYLEQGKINEALKDYTRVIDITDSQFLIEESSKIVSQILQDK